QPERGNNRTKGLRVIACLAASLVLLTCARSAAGKEDVLRLIEPRVEVPSGPKLRFVWDCSAVASHFRIRVVTGDGLPDGGAAVGGKVVWESGPIAGTRRFLTIPSPLRRSAGTSFAWTLEAYSGDKMIAQARQTFRLAS